MCVYIDVVLTSNGLFEVNVDDGGSYLCSTFQNITFDSSSIDHKLNATLGIKELQVQAFMTQGDKGQFGSGKAITMLYTYILTFMQN